MKKIIVFSIAALAFFAFHSCDCPCDNEQKTVEFICSPYDATVGLFNPEATVVDSVFDGDGHRTGTVYKPVNEYCVQSFKFPSDLNKTGDLVNEKTYNSEEGINYFVIDKIPLSAFGINLPYYAALIDKFPPNDKLKGDLLIDSLDVNSRRAFVRARGSITRVNVPPFLSEGSADFCDFIEANGLALKNAQLNMRAELLAFGGDAKNLIPGAKYVSYSSLVSAARIRIVNSRNQTLGVFDSQGNFSVNPNVVFSPEAKKKLSEQNWDFPKIAFALSAKTQNKGYVSISFRAGDVFLYRAANMMDFVIAVVNVDERDAPLKAAKKRLSIIFNRL